MDKSKRRSPDAEPKQFELHGGRLAAILSVVAACLVAGVVATLSLDNTQENQVIVGGLAGAVAAAIALLLRGGGLSEMQNLFATRGAIAVFVPLITGLAAGAFSVLTALALFGDAESLASAAVFGGLYGLLLGGWSNSVIGRARALEEPTVLQAALTQIEEEVVGTRKSRRYNGSVHARFQPAAGHRERVLGSLQIVFVPAHVGREPSEGWLKGPVRIDDGEPAAEVPFEVAVIADTQVVAYPRMREVIAPAAAASDQDEVTLARAEAPSVEATVASPSTVLVDIAQAGRTVQLLEIPLRGRAAAVEQQSTLRT